MNSIDVEYAIKKDVRNNPIIREADTRQRDEFIRTAVLWSLIVGMAMFAAWQHLQIQSNGYKVEQMQHAHAQEEAINRRLRLMIETLRAPQRIELIATTQLHMIVPPPGSTIVIERVAPSAVDKAIVASARSVTGPGR